MDLLQDFPVLNSGNGSDSSKIRFASNLGFSPTLLKHVNLVSNSENSGIIHGSKDVIHQDKMPCASVGPNSSRKVNFFDVLEAVTVSNKDHFEILLWLDRLKVYRRRLLRSVRN